MQTRHSHLLYALIAALAVACSSPTYGAREYEVMFDTTPRGADVYLMRFTSWELAGGPARPTIKPPRPRTCTRC